ncbi:hypothetical protein HHI36_009385 [Cryptolaemus montrouzieri]|uniref:xanthine dehydrogenase n=1 Tax=Cryptolaemus montrouzieri TaxID=559131 RepID=A0ABD2MW07_9CUCU
MADQFQGVNTLVFYVNGKKVEDNDVDPEWTLLYYLRNKLRLCGTKLGCGEGGCGACTVMVSRFDRENKKEIHIPVNACLAPVCSMHGLAVTTVEGIGSTKSRLHPVQERIAKAHGSQCGFCTPGIVMSMYTLLRNNPTPNLSDLDVAFQGNLCRCTGYRPIIEGFKTFTEEWEIAQRATEMNGKICGLGKNCCKFQNGNDNSTRKISATKMNECNKNKINTNKVDAKSPSYINGNGFHEDENGNSNGNQEDVLYRPSDFIPYHPTQEPIFPPELKLSDKYDQEFLIIRGQNCTWYRPKSLEQFLVLKSTYPEAKIVVGNTEVGVEMKFRNLIYPVLIQPSQIKELNSIERVEDGLIVGAGVTLIEIENYFRQQIESLPESKTRLFSTAVKILHYFAGKQIRSVGSLGSNIMTGSPISDMLPVMMAANVSLKLQSIRNTREVKLDNNFFTGYRKSILEPDEVLISIRIPYSSENQYFYAHKQARRREDDIAIVNMCMNVNFEGKTNIIEDIAIAFGGMSFKTVMAPETSRHLKGKHWNKQNIELAFNYLLEDLPLDPAAPGGMILYRRSLTLSLFFKGFLAISKKLYGKVPFIEIADNEISGIDDFHTEDFKSSQYFTIVPDTQQHNPLRKPIVHTSAFKQATGEAIYCDDMPQFPNELYMAFVLSTEANAFITAIDFSEALCTEGVKAFFSAKDIEKDRLFVGTIVHDEKVFFSDEVTSQGQIIGAIVADNQSIAKRAARKVKVSYEKRYPVILTIDEAIKHNSYIGNTPIKSLRKEILKRFY